MTKDSALDLALEALENCTTWHLTREQFDKNITAIKVIKQARSATVQEPVAWKDLTYGNLHHQDFGNSIPLYTTPPAAPVQKKCDCAAHSAADCVCGAWDKSAVAPVQEDWGPGPHEYHSLTAAPVQEPAAWRYRGIFHEFDPSDWAEGPVTPLYTTPPAQPAPVQSAERGEPVTILPDGSAFGMMSFPLPADHWLYAPNEYRDGEYEPIDLPKPILTHALREAVVAAVRYAVRGATMRGQEMDFDPDALVQNAVYALCGPYTTPPAQRQWVGLTEQEAAECWSTGTVRTWQAIEAKLKEKNT